MLNILKWIFPPKKKLNIEMWLKCPNAVTKTVLAKVIEKLPIEGNLIQKDNIILAGKFKDWNKVPEFMQNELIKENKIMVDWKVVKDFIK